MALCAKTEPRIRQTAAHIPGIFGLLSEQARLILHYKGISQQLSARPLGRTSSPILFQPNCCPDGSTFLAKAPWPLIVQCVPDLRAGSPKILYQHQIRGERLVLPVQDRTGGTLGPGETESTKPGSSMSAMRVVFPEAKLRN